MSKPLVQLDSWGQAGNLTPAQEEALRQFTAQVKVESLEKVKFRVESIENVSLRYLRARSLDVNNAMILLNESVRRKTEGRAEYYSKLTPDESANCDVEALKKWYPHAQFGYDKFNRPILFEHSGAVDGNAIHQMTTTENLVNYHWYSMDNQLNRMFDIAAERNAAASAAAGGAEGTTVPTLISTCVVLDLQGLSMHHLSNIVMDHVKAMIALDNTCYPEILGKMLVLNAPWLAVTSWDLVKSWLDPRTQQKIEIMKSGPEQTKRLLEFISPENLPKVYGGTANHLYRMRDATDYVFVPRYGAIKRQLFLWARNSSWIVMSPMGKCI